MGKEIHKIKFMKTEFSEFAQRLQVETELLKSWFAENVFERSTNSCGFELEAWLVDKEYNPSPSCISFLNNINDPRVVPELSLFNFEYNSEPHSIQSNLLNGLHKELTEFWNMAYNAAHSIDAKPVSIGMLPTLALNALHAKNMHPNNRYKALDEQLRKMRQGKAVHLLVAGRESLEIHHENVLIETVSTSLQIHLQLNAAKAIRYYNTGLLIAAPIVAVAANSPFLFGKSLWDETRIPVFEQAVKVPNNHNSELNTSQRVTFGSRYIKESVFELFEENLQYPVLLPELFDSSAESLSHLKIHNGTVWRWNRPIIDKNKEGVPHIRLEHRVPAAGTSSVDIVANIAFFLGLMRYYAVNEEPPESILSFAEAKNNFYNAAKYGLNAQVSWQSAKKVPLRVLMLEELIPNANKGLLELGIAEADINVYLKDVIEQRVKTGLTGAKWQREFVARSQAPANTVFQELLKEYMSLQKQDVPVHEWRF